MLSVMGSEIQTHGIRNVTGDFKFNHTGSEIHTGFEMILYRTFVLLNTCGGDITWSTEPCIPQGFRCRCRRRVAGTRCSESRSIKHGSWSQPSNFTFQEILLITHDIVCRENGHQTQKEHCLNQHTIADWGMFCRETMLVFMEGCSEKIGGPNKAVERKHVMLNVHQSR